MFHPRTVGAQVSYERCGVINASSREEGRGQSSGKHHKVCSSSCCCCCKSAVGIKWRLQAAGCRRTVSKED